MAALPDVIDASDAAKAGDDITTAELSTDMLHKTDFETLRGNNDVFIYLMMRFRASRNVYGMALFPPDVQVCRAFGDEAGRLPRHARRRARRRWWQAGAGPACHCELAWELCRRMDACDAVAGHASSGQVGGAGARAGEPELASCFAFEGGAERGHATLSGTRARLASAFALASRTGPAWIDKVTQGSPASRLFCGPRFFLRAFGAQIACGGP